MRNYSENKLFFENLRDEFVARIEKELQTPGDFPIVSFLIQSEDIGLLHADQSSENYVEKLQQLKDALKTLDFDEDPLRFAKAIRQLLIMISPTLDLFLSTGTIKYAETARRVGDFIALRPQPLTKEERTVQRLQLHFPSVDFQKMRDQIVSEIDNEFKRSLTSAFRISTGRSLILREINQKISRLNLTTYQGCYSVLELAFQYLRLGSTKMDVVTDAIKPVANKREERKLLDIFVAVFESDRVTVQESQAVFSSLAFLSEEERTMKALLKAGFNLAALRKAMIRNVELLKTEITRILSQSPDGRARESCLIAGKKLQVIATVLSCLQDKDPKDQYRVAQLALYLVSVTFFEYKVSRDIFLDAAGITIFGPDVVTGGTILKIECLERFSKCVIYQPALVDALLTPPPKTSPDQSRGRGFFDNREDTDSPGPPLERKDTMEPKKPGQK